MEAAPGQKEDVGWRLFAAHVSIFGSPVTSVMFECSKETAAPGFNQFNCTSRITRHQSPWQTLGTQITASTGTVDLSYVVLTRLYVVVQPLSLYSLVCLFQTQSRWSQAGEQSMHISLCFLLFFFVKKYPQRCLPSIFSLPSNTLLFLCVRAKPISERN